MNEKQKEIIEDYADFIMDEVSENVCEKCNDYVYHNSVVLDMRILLKEFMVKIQEVED